MDVEIHTEISASVETDGYESCGEECTMPYEITLAIGEKEYTIGGWRLCGWLAPGAHADLDGSGLANWGDSQPGGWTDCDGDGAVGGKPSVREEGDYNEPILIWGGEGQSSVEVTPDEVPEWSEAIAKVDSRDPDADWTDADEADEQAAIEMRESIADRLSKVIRDTAESVDCPEPDSETIYDDLDEIDGFKELPVRLGNWNGAGLVLAWRSGSDEYHHRYWPDRDDVVEAIKDTQDFVVDEIEATIESMTSR